MKKIILLSTLCCLLLSYGGTQVFAASCLQFKNTLILNSNDSTTQGEVSKLQSFLANRGYYGSSISGVYDRATAKAVIAFQRANNIPVDVNPWASAIIGPKTKEKIIAITCPQIKIKNPISTATPTPTPTTTTTPTPIYTNTPTPSSTSGQATPSSTYTATPTYTYVPTPTYSPTPSPTYSYTPTPTATPTPSSSPTSKSSTLDFMANVFGILKGWLLK